MRKQLHEAEEIDRYIFQRMDEPSRQQFEARMLIEPELEEKVHHQQKAHWLIRWFGRRQQRVRLESLYGRLMRDEDFKQAITALFL